MSSASEAKIFKCAVPAMLCALATQSFAEEVRIHDVRPVAAATTKLEEQFHIPITYEDPPYLFGGDLEDVTAKVARPEYLVSGKPIRVIKGMKKRELRFLPGPALTPEGQQAAIQSGLDANNRSEHPPAVFKVQRQGGRFHIFPLRVKDSSGAYMAYTSLLDVRITIEPKDRPCWDFLDELCRSLSRTRGISIGIGSGGPGGNCSTKLGGENTSARELLLAYFWEIENRPYASGKASWQLLSDASQPNDFALNLYHVRSDLPVTSPQPDPTSETPKTRPKSVDPHGARWGTFH